MSQQIKGDEMEADETKYVAHSNGKQYECLSVNLKNSTALIGVPGWSFPQWCLMERIEPAQEGAA